MGMRRLRAEARPYRRTMILCSRRVATSAKLELHGLPLWLWCVLHFAFDLLADSRHASWQTSGDPLRATHARLALCAFRSAGAAGSLCQPAADRRDVRREPRRGL